MNRHSFEKYRRKNPGLAGVSRPGLSAFSGAVVIPVYDECDTLGATIASLDKSRRARRIAIVCVLNSPDDASDGANAPLRNLVAGSAFAVPNLYWWDAGVISDGVGEARKLGFDTILQTVEPEKAEDFLLFSCDADSPVAENYFDVLEASYQNAPDVAAFLPSVRHAPAAAPELERAIRAYEGYLYDYCGGLKAAGSPYAYLTIGSAMSFRASAYVEAGGMRKRRTGEDFYFLEALAKSSSFSVVQLSDVLVFPASRLSSRVPVGTGTRLAELLHGGGLPRFAPNAFPDLKRLLAAATEEGLADPETFLGRVPASARRFLLERKFPEAWRNVVANSGGKAKVPAFHRWFDALKTLQFLKQC